MAKRVTEEIREDAFEGGGAFAVEPAEFLIGLEDGWLGGLLGIGREHRVILDRHAGAI
jgi:hypothetical protein